MPSPPPSRSSQADLRIESERRGGVLVVKLIGSANMDVSMGIRDRIVALIDEHTHRIVIELSRLDFISSVGLGEIISAHIRCCRHGIELKLAGPKPAISGILAKTKLTKLFHIYDSVDMAMAAPD